mmetsp:Transcript_14562/g.31551  ORF Transcript_14562/g.31551 Transcript_14562/m.31551 type:complete len:986 (+) Transcript_14562:302-3259(+)
MRPSSAATRSSSSTALVALCAATAVAVGTGCWYMHMHLTRKQRRAEDGTPTNEEVDAGNATTCTTSNTEERQQQDADRRLDAAVSAQSAQASSGTTLIGGDIVPRSVVIESSGSSKEEEEGEAKVRDLRSDLRPIQQPGTITVAYATTTSTCQSLAEKLRKHLDLKLLATTGTTTTVVQICRVEELDWWDEVLNPPDLGSDCNECDDDEKKMDSPNNTSTSSVDASGDGDADATPPLPPPIVLFILPTWTGGTLPPTAHAALLTSLEEISTDWRVAPNPLSRRRLVGSNKFGKRHGTKRQQQHVVDQTMRVASFGIGSSAYDPATFCRPAYQVVDVLVTKLGGRQLLRVGTGDVESGDYRVDFGRWMDDVMDRIAADDAWGGIGDVNGTRPTYTSTSGKAKEDAVGCCGGKDTASANDTSTSDECACKSEAGTHDGGEAAAAGCCGGGGGRGGAADDNNNKTTAAGANEESDDESAYESDYYTDDDEDEAENKEPDIMDLEDIGNAMKSSAQHQRANGKKGPPKEMVTPKQAVALKKEGYKLIGTHSAVKLCRWTKHQLRGRGGCYKHTHYGITSYQCMEATPSLACANKCVFCWRHHKNPVGREWRWKTDDPYMIVDEAVKEHIHMIKETKGIPGVRMDRWEQAHTVRHCALSLVGEPIMYPRIDELLGELHNRKISTFLVTNGQHPDAIENLRPITQLYVSVDAPTPESLEAIDRPLFRDAWERLRRSLRCLKDKGQRTVARLTVVKGWNSDEVEGYAKLVALGHCSLVEVKGVTFCGKSDASNLNMSNTPWHHEVVALTVRLRDELNRMHEAGGDDPPPRYELACEHKHSVSVLLARVDQFSVEDPVTGERKWRTWIDYEKFQELAVKAAADPTFTFGVEDYTAETPSWALFGASEEGFDPTDTRHRKKKKHPKYTKFDKDGVPTHDHAGNVICEEERSGLRQLMEEKMKEVGSGESVMALKGGEIKVSDASLMFRGLTITK